MEGITDIISILWDLFIYFIYVIIFCYAVIYGIRFMKDFPNLFPNLKNEKRTSELKAEIIDVKTGTGRDMLPYFQLKCGYYDKSRDKMIIFKSKKVIGFTRKEKGDECTVFYDPQNIKNYVVIPDKM